MGEMGKAMMGTGEAEGDNRAIEAAEKAIANPLLDGVSMKGAKGVIISITGGEDMRLMEVDEAANHIKDLVDPDANIIWGSAFNNDLEGRIRVSVVATGIDSEAVAVAPPAPAKVFAFPAANRPNLFQPATQAAPVVEESVAEPEAADALELTEETSAEELSLEAFAEDAASDELVLDSESVEQPTSFIEEEVAEEPTTPAGTRPWLQERAPAARPATGGTLFERMSNIARGAAKAQVDEEQPRTARDPLDIPRFLNRQNNQ
jgi:cell division protein FtsZ